MNKGKEQGNSIRYFGLDIIRCCAIFFVMASHFFSLHTEFRTTIFEGCSMFIQATFSSFFSMGVSLFILLTGYLNINKKISKKYYKGMQKVIYSYLLFSVITILFKKYYLHQEFSWIQWLLKILNFTAIPYAWYVEMWIGLFLLIPFLNILYKGIPTKKQKQVLIISLFLLTALPNLLNRYGLYLAPAFWASCFPLTFYFIGSYIQEYRPQISKWIILISMLAICLINPVFNVLFVKGRTLIHIAGDAMGVFGLPLSVLFFLLCYQIKLKSNTIALKISLLSFDMYMCCYIFDAIYYPIFKEHYFISQSQFGIYFFIIVPLVFISSFVTAWVKDLLSRVP